MESTTYSARKKDGVTTGYHMTCKLHQQCHKELAASVAGGLQEARRVLKAWTLLGASLPGRVAHMEVSHKTCCSRLSRTVTSALRMNSTSWHPHQHRARHRHSTFHAFCCNYLCKDASQRSADNLLGEAGNVPQELHEAMVLLAREGKIPRTTASQRARNNITNNSSYEVPQELEAALRAGYLHPNLPPPQGLVWRCRPGGHWKLGLRGG